MRANIHENQSNSLWHLFEKMHSQKLYRLSDDYLGDLSFFMLRDLSKNIDLYQYRHRSLSQMLQLW